MVQRRLELFLAAVTLTVFEVRALIQPNATDICLPFQSNQNCSDLPATCIVCNFNTSCVYGANTSVQCSPKSDVVCKVRCWCGVCGACIGWVCSYGSRLTGYLPLFVSTTGRPKLHSHLPLYVLLSASP